MKLLQWVLSGALVLVTFNPSQAQIPYRPFRHSWPGMIGQRNYPLPNYQAPNYPVPTYPSPNYQNPGYQMPMNPADGRRVWVYGNQGEGSFRQLNDGSWVESNYSGQYYYRELGRTPQFVDLFDPNRNVFVRIQDGMMFSHGLGQYNWNPGYSGHWE